MINKSKSFPLVALAAVMDADKATLDAFIPFAVQDRSEYQVTDIDNKPVLGDNGKPIIGKTKPIGVILHQTGSTIHGTAKVTPFYPTVCQVVATTYPSKQIDNAGQMVRGSTFHLRGYLFNLEDHPEIEDLYDQNETGRWDIDKLQAKFEDYDLDKLIKEGFLIVRNIPESNDPAVEMSWTNYIGAAQGDQTRAQRGKDHPNLIHRNGCPTYIINRTGSDGKPVSVEVVEWNSMPGVEKFMLDIWTKYPWMPIPKETKDTLGIIFRPIDEGGYLPFTDRAPSQVRKRALEGANGFQTGVVGVNAQIPDSTVSGGLGLLTDDTEELEELNTTNETTNEVSNTDTNELNATNSVEEPVA